MSVGLTLIAGGGAVWAVVLGLAQLESARGDAAGVRLARELAPGDAGYAAQWSQLAANPQESLEALQTAVRLNPYYSWAWIQLGLAMEERGNPSLGERYLQRAAQADRGWNARWVLCNFYFRRGEPEKFWYWARQTLSVESADAGPVLRLAWRMTPDAGTLFERAVPADAGARRKFLAFLVTEHPGGFPGSILQKLMAAAQRADAPMLAEFSEKLLDAGQTEDALAVWNQACRNRLLAFEAIEPEKGRVLTNPEIASFPSGKGFDWKLNAVEGVTLEGGRTLRFSGREPEHGRILSQRVPVIPKERYEFRYQLRGPGDNAAAGIRWRVFEGTKLLAESDGQAGNDGTERKLAFATLSQRLITLALEYDRPRGETRFAGVVTLARQAISRAAP